MSSGDDFPEVEPRRASVEVVAVHPADAEEAQAGGADRLHVGRPVDGQLLALEPAAVSAIVRSTDLPVRVSLRLTPGFTTSGGELTRLRGLVTDYLSVGAEGFCFGFLTRDLDVDAEVCLMVADALAGAPWTFDAAFDHALDARHAWRAIRGIPGLDTVHTSGSILGVGTGLDDLLALAHSDARFAAAAAADAGLRAEDVPWLVRAGITRVHLGAAVRPGGSWDRAHVDAGFVRSWRLLLDAAVDPQRGRPQAG